MSLKTFGCIFLFLDFFVRCFSSCLFVMSRSVWIENGKVFQWLFNWRHCCSISPHRTAARAKLLSLRRVLVKLHRENYLFVQCAVCLFVFLLLLLFPLFRSDNKFYRKMPDCLRSSCSFHTFRHSPSSASCVQQFCLLAATPFSHDNFISLSLPFPSMLRSHDRLSSILFLIYI